MSEVLRFWCNEARNIRCVREEDYDASQVELAALREELAKSNELLSQARGMVNGATDEWHVEVQKLIGEK